MLICKDCLRPFKEYGSWWTRRNGKIDYRCKCGSKHKPKDVTKKEWQKYKEGFNYHEIENDNKGDTKRLLIIADLHCGHKSGLTPPEWFCNESNKKRRRIQEESWDWFKGTVNEIGFVDVVVANGDIIDGKGFKSGGTELITSDLFKQIKIAERCIDEIDFNKIFFTYGTTYHVSSNGDDFEVSLADKFNTVIKDHLWLDINGCVFDFKHKVSSSSVFSGRATALLKEVLWNREWAATGEAPKADVFIRSHVHYHTSVTDNNKYLAMSTPALQVADTKFGGRECSGVVDFGVILIEIPGDFKNVNDLNVRVYTKNLESMESKSIII